MRGLNGSRLLCPVLHARTESRRNVASPVAKINGERILGGGERSARERRGGQEREAGAVTGTGAGNGVEATTETGAGSVAGKIETGAESAVGTTKMTGGTTVEVVEITVVVVTKKRVKIVAGVTKIVAETSSRKGVETKARRDMTASMTNENPENKPAAETRHHVKRSCLTTRKIITSKVSNHLM